MAKYSLFPVFATVLCAASLFSCSSNSSDDPSSSSGTPSSNSKGSSSSVNGSSSSMISSSSSVSDPDLLIKKTITLSSTGDNYADIDGDVTTYKQAGAKNNLKKIDLIAFCGTSLYWCRNNSVYTPDEVGLFYDDDNDFIGSKDVWFFVIPSAQAGIFRTATRFSEIRTTLNNFLNSINGTECEDCTEIPIAKDKVFFVNTSEDKKRVVIVKATGNQSVDLEIIQIPD